MSYITNADIELRLGTAGLVQLADDDEDGIADAAVVDEARLAAEGEVNSYLARRYAVPIDLTVHPEVADLLASLSLDLAEHRLRARRPPVPEDARRRRDAAVEWLRRLGNGVVDLPSVSAVAGNRAKGTIAATRGAARVLTREELSGH